MVAKRRQCSHRSTITPNKTCSAHLYRCIKIRVGRSLKLAHCMRNLVPSRNQAAYELSRTKSSFFFLALKELQDLCADRIVLVATDNTTVVSYINKEGGMRSDPLCVLLWRILTWCTRKQSDSKSLAHFRPAERGSRQAIQARPDHPNRVISPSRGLQINMQQVAPGQDRLIHHGVQQVASVCVTGTESPDHSSGCTQSAMGGSGCIRLPTSSHIAQSGGEVAGLPMQENNSNCSGVAQHALVLGSSGHVQPNPTKHAQSAQSVDTVLQSDPSQKSDKSKSPCMAPRASAIKEQGFSEAVAARIEAPQRGSTRSVYEAKWAIFTFYIFTHQVDFGAPPVKSVADFLMYLLEDTKLQPSTIDGYRSAIAD